MAAYDPDIYNCLRQLRRDDTFRGDDPFSRSASALMTSFVGRLPSN